MSEYLHWLVSGLDSFYIFSGLQSTVALVHGSSLLFWILIFTIARYHAPDILIWIGYLFAPRKFQPPALVKYAGAKPLVSVIIAGRNPGYSIVTCIRSVLESDYRNVEVIFADDHSTDDSVTLARAFERTGRVRVCANANHSGKPANLNVALMLARGEFIFVLDADTQIFHDTIDRMLPYFEDPQVGGVSPSIRVRNPNASILTRFQSIEYIMTYTLAQLWRDRLGMIAILSGMGTMFRTAAVRGLGGYDMGLGDDTDITIRLRKTHWKLRMSMTARISTDVPVTLRHLMRQRSRWTRNMVKMRLRKHRDLGTFRYGFLNGIVFYEQVLNRVIHPLLIVGLAIYSHVWLGASAPVLVGGLYWFTAAAMAIKFAIGNDMTRGTPAWRYFWLVPFYIFYRIPLLLVQVTQVLRELLHIKLWHPYVPRRIWDQIPHH